MSHSDLRSKERHSHSDHYSRRKRHRSRSTDSEESRHRRRSRDSRDRSPNSPAKIETKFNYQQSSVPSLIITGLNSSILKDDLIKSLLEVKATYKRVLPSEGVAIIEFHSFIEATRFLELTRGRLNISDDSFVVRHLNSQELKLYYSENTEDDARRFHVEETNPSNVLIFRGLDESTTEEDIRNAVCHITEKVVYDVRLIKDKISGVSRGFCFIEMGSAQDAAALIYKIKNMMPPFSIHSRQIGVGYAKNNFGLSCNVRVNNNSVASNAIAAARAASSTLPSNLQDPKPASQIVQNFNCVIPGDPKNFVYDPSTGYYIDPITNFYHDSNTGTFYNPFTQDFLFFNPITNSLVPFSRNTVETESAQPKTDETAKEKSSKPPPTLTKAQEVSKDVERWAKKVNTVTASKMTIKKQRLQEVHEKQKRTVELKDKIEAQELYETLSSAPIKSSDLRDRQQLDETLKSDPNLSVKDLVCLLCQRKFSNKEVLIKHITSSKLHANNLEKLSQNVNP